MSDASRDTRGRRGSRLRGRLDLAMESTFLRAQDPAEISPPSKVASIRARLFRQQYERYWPTAFATLSVEPGRRRYDRLSCERAAAARGNPPVLENLYGRGWKSVTRTADYGSSSVLFSYQRTMIQCLRHGSMSLLHFSLDSGAGQARDRAILFGIPSKYSTI
jgi:hypothetical protein